MVVFMRCGTKLPNLLKTYKSHILRNVHLRTFCLANNYEIDLKLNNVSLKNYIRSIEKEYDLLSQNAESRNSSRLVDLQPVIHILKERNNVINSIKNIQELLQDKDKDLQQLAIEEKTNFEAQIKELDERLLNVLLLVKNIEDSYNSIVLEVQSGVGGQEAMLFAGQMFNMYCKFAAYQGWNVEIAEYLETDIGGIRFASALIDGQSAYKYFKHEGGVHRVQRIPATEKAGRIHTSTVSVIALPQPTDIEVNIQQKDLRIETKRASGAGGQHVNTTDSAVRITHLPTGISVECQTDRSQIKNKKFAMARLKALLYEKQLDTQVTENKALRKSQVKSNNRNEKIRTYNFNQDRITDHRLKGVHFHNLDVFMNSGEDLGKLIQLLDYQEKVDFLLQKVESK